MQFIDSSTDGSNAMVRVEFTVQFKYAVVCIIPEAQNKVCPTPTQSLPHHCPSKSSLSVSGHETLIIKPVAKLEGELQG